MIAVRSENSPQKKTEHIRFTNVKDWQGDLEVVFSQVHLLPHFRYTLVTPSLQSQSTSQNDQRSLLISDQKTTSCSGHHLPELHVPRLLRATKQVKTGHALQAICRHRRGVKTNFPKAINTYFKNISNKENNNIYIYTYTHIIHIRMYREFLVCCTTMVHTLCFVSIGKSMHIGQRTTSAALPREWRHLFAGETLDKKSAQRLVLTLAH